MRIATSTSTSRPTLWLLGTLLLSLFCVFKAAPATWFGAEQTSKPVYQTGGVTYGLKSVADYRVGDEIYAFNHETARLEVRRVAQVFQRESDHLRMLTVRASDGSTRTIATTDEHPFYGVEQGAYVAAKELLRGQQFRCMDGSLQTLVKTVREEHPECVTVYNLEVEGLHNYFVAPLGDAATPVLAHNRCELDDIVPLNGSGGAGKIYWIPPDQLKSGKGYIGKTVQKLRKRMQGHKKRTITGNAPKPALLADNLTEAEANGLEHMFIRDIGLDNLDNDIHAHASLSDILDALHILRGDGTLPPGTQMILPFSD